MQAQPPAHRVIDPNHPGIWSPPRAAEMCVCLSLPLIKLFAWGEGESGGHVLRETTSLGLRGLVCPSRTSERGGEGDGMKGGGGEGKCERERTMDRLRYYIPGH